MIEFEGKIYHSLSQLSREHGLNIATVSSRLHAGRTIEEAIYFTPQKGRKAGCYPLERKLAEPKIFDENGVGYVSTAQMLRAKGMKSDTYYHRLNRGWSREEALMPTLESGRRRHD